YSAKAFFGPRPGTDIIWRTPAGIFDRSSSSDSIVPVRRNSSTFSPIERPTLGISRMAFRSSLETSAWYPPTARAAFSYALGLNGSPEEIDKRSAYSSRTASTVSFARGTGESYRRRSVRLGLDHAEQPEQQRLLGVHPVLGLVPHDGVRAVEHLVRDLHTAMG